MNSKSAVAILLLAIFALSTIAIIPIKPANASGSSSSTLTLSDAELMSDSFTYQWGPGTLAAKTLIAPGVKFDLTGLQPAVDTGVADNFPVDALAGGATEDYGYGFAGPYNFSGYKQYSMCVENTGTETVTVALCMNTGWTIDWSGGLWKGSDGFGASPARDTFWRSDWVYIAAGECKIICLNFSSATCYNAKDDPVVAWQHPDATTGVQVQRLDEVSDIGVQVQGNGAGSIIIKGTQLYIDPPVVNKTPSDVNSFFDVYVTLKNFANFAGFDIKLTWNGALITCTSVDYTTTLDALWGANNWAVVIESSGVGYYELVAVALTTSASNTGAQALFKLTFKVVKSSNFQLSTPIHFDVASLSDNSIPIPKSICAVVTDGTYTMSGTTPDLEFNVLKYNKTTHTYEPVTLPDHFEYGNLFEVQVYVTGISANSPLEDYNMIINFNPGLAVFKDVDVWGIFGTGSFTNTTTAIHVWGNGSPWHGAEGLLFTLTFHVEFAATPDHIWKYGNANNMTFQVWLADATLSFGALGTIGIGGIATPSALTFEVDFIRGDVDCNGVVNMADISAVAYYYGDPASARPEYDLTNDGNINLYDLVTIATNYGYGGP